MTAFENNVEQEFVAETEGFFADFSRYPIEADPNRTPFDQGQGVCAKCSLLY